MMSGEDGALMVLLLGLLIYPLLVWHGRVWAASLLFVAVFVQAAVLTFRRNKEGYGRNKMDFFPWNEARIVKKRVRDSTVIDCGWSLDHPKDNDNIFSMDDPVVRGYSNLSSSS